MIPHLLHTTGRAVAVVQNQTHTIRNVLQLQSSGPSSGSGSSWGNGPGPGSSKYGAGSRFYAGYNTAGRAVTQANAVTSHDGQLTQTDENDDLTPKRHVIKPSATTAAPKPRRARIRSSSVSLAGPGAVERAEHMGVLKTVQLHARGKHTFAPAESMASAKEKLLADPLSAEPLLVRRNSTSAPLSPLLHAADPPAPPSPLQRGQRPPLPPDDEIVDKFQFMASAGMKREVARMSREVLKLDNAPIEYHNAALAALSNVMPRGEPIGQVVQYYNSMLEKSIVPNVYTYDVIINALTERDLAVHEAQLAVDYRTKRRDLGALLERQDIGNPYAEQLAQEKNFQTALELFNAVLAVNGRNGLQRKTFMNLLSCAARYGDVAAAIHIFAQIEARTDLPAGHEIYRSLLMTYVKAGLPNDAIAIFSRYLKVTSTGNVWDPENKRPTSRRSQVKIWNMAIEAHFAAGRPDKAIALIEQMLESTNDNFVAADIPTVTSSTFVTVIQGFIAAGDIDSALSWFDKLLAVPHKPLEDPFQGMGGLATRPHSFLWAIMIDALATHDRTDDLIRIYKALRDTYAAEDGVSVSGHSRRVVHVAVLNASSTMEPAKACEALLFVLRDIGAEKDVQPSKARNLLVKRVCIALARLGVYDEPIALVYSNALVVAGSPGAGDHLERDQVQQFISAVYQSAAKGLGQMDFASALNLTRLAAQYDVAPKLMFAPVFLDAYVRSRVLIHLEELTPQDWNILFTYAAKYELNQFSEAPEACATVPEFSGLKLVLNDLVAQGHGMNILDLNTARQVIAALLAHYGIAGASEMMANLGPTFELALEHHKEIQEAALQNSLVPDSVTSTDALTSELPENYNDGRVKVDRFLSRNILAALNMRPSVDLEQPYKMFEQGLTQGLLPNTSVLAGLIQVVGRAKMLERVRELYTAAQAVLHTLPEEARMSEWAHIEDSMIIALAHAGHPDAAHVHRCRLLERGFSPTADSYSILIQLVKDTTDDASGAMNLFKEAIDYGVKPNIYLYNNIISKLAKARKADQALELFHQMKAQGLRPTSITYGAVIGACARVGDAVSAEALFKEMTYSDSFKPRVPPYNTMMQLYAHTKPSRTSVLYFYDEMRKAKVRPTSHTYKLLMDAYGTIEPIQLDKMQEVFAQLQADPSAELTGAHFASLINAHGCNAKDIRAALTIFEDLTNGKYPNAPKPDAVVFEAVINVVVAHKRTDLIPVYIAQMTEAGVHMTAYIANFLIKGYALSGDIDQARSIFESLSDPPAGVAAPNNHAPHSPDLSSESEVSVMEPVYREPSTWEVMVRAELGAGNPDAAYHLLQRIRERGYPEAVYSRISGIMVDNSAVY